MTAAIRGSRTSAFRTGSVGLNGCQSAPLVLDQQATQLGVLGSETLNVLIAHITEDSNRPQRPR